MKFGSLFAGVGGFDCGMELAGMECCWQVEINPFRRKVLATHWPEVNRYEDIQECGSDNLEPVDCITAGVPCQDWSVAGRRAGIKGKRSGLFFEFARILQELRPRWFVFENVPGLFSSNRGRDFAEVQRVLMVECGYGISWRVLDSQFFGVAQRRRRLYIVGYLGAPCPAEILFELPGSGRDSEAGEEAGEDLARTLTKGSGVNSNPPGRRQEDDYNLAIYKRRGGFGWSEKRDGIVPTLEASGGSHQGGSEITPIVVAASITPGSGRIGSRGADDGANLVYGTLKSHRTGGWTPEPGEHLAVVSVAQNQRGELRTSKIAAQLTTGGGKPGEGYPCVAFVHPRQLRNSESSNQVGIKPGAKVSDSLTSEGPGAVAYTIPSVHRGIGQGHNTNYVSAPTDPDGVRDVAGLPEGLDDPGEFPLLPKGMDSPRYQALGDAVSVPAADWIGRRIVRFIES